MTFSRRLVSAVLICGVANDWRSKEAPRDVRGDERPAAAARSEEAGRARRGIERANTILNYFQLMTEIGRIEVKSGCGEIVACCCTLFVRLACAAG